MNSAQKNPPSGWPTSFINAANQSIRVNGIPFAYRDIGPTTGVPLVMFNHWGAVLDNFDPAIIDGLARRSSISTLPRASQAVTNTRMPAMLAVAGLVPWAEDGIRQISRRSSPRLW